MILLRHAKSNHALGLPDFDRPLKERGKRQAQKIGAWMQQSQLLPDLVVSSPANRALITIEWALMAAGQSAQPIETDERLYSDSMKQIWAVLHDQDERHKRLMLVGHNPWMESLLRHLARDLPQAADPYCIMKTGTLVRLAMPTNWDKLPKGCARILNYVLPASLPDRFPYCGSQGLEFRERPAYYYTQSAVIPYRKRAKGLEILIVSSSKGRHWTVPKGIDEPGLSAQRSAAKEAEEEAGVTGHVARQSLGNYSYQKWGAPCQVAVFPMRVTKVLPEERWDENDRIRRWVEPGEAVALVKETALKAILADFAARFGPAA